MADRWIRNALGHEPQWDMGDKEIPPLEAAIVMRAMPPLVRENAIVNGVDSGKVIDARKRFMGFEVLSHTD